MAPSRAQPAWTAGLAPRAIAEARALEERSRLAVSGAVNPASVLEPARRLYDRATAMGHAGLEAITANLLGKLSSLSGDNAAGVAWFERARVAAQALGDPALIGMIDGHLGNALRNVGRIAEARDAYQRVIDNAADDWPPEYVVNALTNLAIVHQDFGLLRDARLGLKEARSRARAAGLDGALVLIAANLGSVYQRGGDTEGALEYFREALEAAREVGDARTEAAMLGNIASIELAEGDLEGAERDHRAAIELAERLGAGAIRALSLAELGEILARRGAHSEAEDLLRRALNDARRTATPLLVTQILRTLGVVVAHAGEARRAEALELLGEAAATGQVLQAQLTRASDGPRVQHRLASIYQRAVEIDSASDHPVQGFLASEIGRSAFLRRRLGTAVADPSSPPGPGPATGFAEAGPFGTLEAALPPLEDNVLLLSYFETEVKLFTFLVRPSRSDVRVVVRELGSSLRRAQSELAREVIAYGERGNSGETWLAVGEDVLAPVADHFEPDDVIYVVPHGHLLGLPVHALRIGGRRLIERWPVAYLPSSLVAGTLVSDGRRPDARLSLGVEFVSEAEQVAAVLGAEKLIGDGLSKRTVTKAFEGADLIHVSAHGYFTPTNPEHSGILLRPFAGASKAFRAWAKEAVDLTDEDLLALATDEGTRQTMLMASDIERLRLRARLLTLSACSSGLISIGPGDDPSGLTTAFIGAGVRNIVASLWKVDPAATEEFMLGFYRAVEADPSGWRRLPQALQVATLETMARRPHTYFWAPFILIGGLVAPTVTE